MSDSTTQLRPARPEGNRERAVAPPAGRRSAAALKTWLSRCAMQYCGVVVLIVGLMLGLALKGSSAETSSFQDLAQRATAAREKNDSALAIELYKKATTQRPDWQEGWWYLGSLLYDNGRFPAAAQALHRLTVLDPKLGGAWALQGLSEFESSHYDQAFKQLQQARSLGTEDAALADVVDYHLAVLLNVRGESEMASALLSSLLLRGRHSEDLQVALGLALLRVPLLPSQVDPSKDAMVHDAGTLAAVVAHHQYEAAEAGFKGFLEKYPDAAFVHYAWGTMLAKQGRDSAAEAQFEAETRLNAGSALAYSEWAYLAMKASRYDEAISHARKAIALSPGSYTGHYTLGSAFLATGQTEAAVAELEQARKLVPESPEIRYALSRAYAKLGKKELAQREAAEFQRLKSKRSARTQTGQKSAADVPTLTGATSQESSPRQ